MRSAARGGSAGSCERPRRRLPGDRRAGSAGRPCGEAQPESPGGCAHGPAACGLSKLLQLPTPPLSEHQLKRSEEHKYQSAGRSLPELLMQGYWEWLVRRVPAWIAPDLITVVGLLINIFTTLLLVYYCPTATEQISPHEYNMKLKPSPGRTTLKSSVIPMPN